MARQHRIDYPGAVHHVMNRGANRQIIFYDDSDRRLFLRIWNEAVFRFGVELLVFTLMGNHFHVVLRTPQAQLSRTMQFVARSYTQQFNARHGRDGALLRGRFRSIVVDSDRYLLEVARYIDLNPVDAGLCTLHALAHSPWSSFGVYVGERSRPAWLSTDLIRSQIAAGGAYLDFVEQRVRNPAVERFYTTSLSQQVVLGDQAFADQVRARIGSDVPVVPGVSRIQLQDVHDAASAVGASAHRLTSRTEEQLRFAALSVSHMLTGESLRALAEHFGYSSAQAASNAIKRLSNSTESDFLRLREDVLRELGRDADGAPRQL